MFNKAKFKAAMAMAGKTQKDVAEVLHINDSTLYRKMNGLSEFDRSEIQILCEFLKLETPMEIFFDQ